MLDANSKVVLPDVLCIEFAEIVSVIARVNGDG